MPPKQPPAPGADPASPLQVARGPATSPSRPENTGNLAELPPPSGHSRNPREDAGARRHPPPGSPPSGRGSRTQASHSGSETPLNRPFSPDPKYTAASPQTRETDAQSRSADRPDLNHLPLGDPGPCETTPFGPKEPRTPINEPLVPGPRSPPQGTRVTHQSPATPSTWDPGSRHPPHPPAAATPPLAAAARCRGTASEPPALPPAEPRAHQAAPRRPRSRPRRSPPARPRLRVPLPAPPQRRRAPRLLTWSASGGERTRADRGREARATRRGGQACGCRSCSLSARKRWCEESPPAPRAAGRPSPSRGRRSSREIRATARGGATAGRGGSASDSPESLLAAARKVGLGARYGQ
ncbi:nascent polypeptide-associated complex subunit alpha, muscle-specific form-like [Talpa occidentalis]|uniref:nascent polypeptide-associated complex subunit alpha, muscle-specific form-like n=1 Tax=Talpa occidentalis TaxID=50954 RepID=UPI0018905DEF|nr:nascent polypeptide-associated complex subunit alpha, muscle-specific form-like [Talpa occidentalis]